MRIEVHCFGPTQRFVGADRLELELNDAACVADALAALGHGREDFAALLGRCAVAVGDELVRRTHPLAPGDALALLPPVAGG